MSAYPREDEERIYLQTQVRAWTSSGLLGKEQGAALDAELRTDLRRTNVILRAVLAFFTLVITASAIGLMFLTSGIRGEGAAAVLLALSAIGCFAAAEMAVSAFRFYRFGVEEAWAAGGVVLLAVSVGIMAQQFHVPSPERVAVAVFSAGALGVYWRYGFVYALVAAMAAAASIPIMIDVSLPVQRIAAVAVLAVAWAIARVLRRGNHGTYLEGDYEIAQAAAWAGMYLMLNLKLSDPLMLGLRSALSTDWFYWTTYAAIWLIPAAGLYAAVRDRDRSLLTVNIILALITLATNKTYLGLEHQSWDPILLGVLLMGAAIGVRRWLLAGENQQRSGFTPVRIMDFDRDLIRVVANVSAGFHTHATPPPHSPDPGFGGGRAGGGGASGSY
jgi:hypothetical protein